MPEHEPSQQDEIKKLLQENQELLKDNNLMLHKIRRDATIAMALRVIWFAAVIGVPLALYYFVLEPNVSTLQDAFHILIQGAKDVTGLREFFSTVQPR